MKKKLQTLFASIIVVLVVLCTFIALIFKLGRKEQEINEQIQQERLYLSAASDFLSATEEMVIAGRGYYIAKHADLLRNFQIARIHVLTRYNALKQHPSYKQANVEITNNLQATLMKRIRLSDSIVLFAGEKQTTRFNLSKAILDGNHYSVMLSESVNILTKQGVTKIEQLEKESSATPQLQQFFFIATIIVLVFAMVIGFLYLQQNSKARIRAQEYLRSYRQSNHFLNSLSEGIVVQDQSGHIIECNKAAAEILGLTFDQMQGRTSVDPRWKSIHEDGSDFPGEQHPAMQVLATGESKENIIMGVHKPNGELTWLRINSHPVRDTKDGMVISAVTGFVDITEQKKQDDLIKHSEFLMKSSMNAIKEGFHLVDRNYNIVILNDASKKIFSESIGVELKEGDHIPDFLPDERKLPTVANLKKVFEGDAIEYEAQYHHKHFVWLNWSITPVRDQNDHVQFACVLFKDITGQKLKEQKVKEDEERLRMALEKTGDNAWEHNFDTGITWFSSANNHLTGVTTEDAAQDNNKHYWWQQTHPEDKPLLIQNDEEYKTGARSEHSLEYRIFHKDGSLKWVLDRGVVVERDTKGKPLRIVGTHTDISNEKFLQQQLLKQEQQKKKEIVEAVIQAQEKEREEIAQELHEDIAQVLSSVKMLLTAADKNVLPAGKAAIELSNERISRVVDEIRLISQNINSSTLHQVGLKNAILDIISHAEVISSIQFDFQTLQYNEQKKAEFTIELTMLRLLQAMIKNIVRHSEATKAEVELYNDDLFLHLTVSDNGKGFLLENAIRGLGIQTIINRAEQYGGQVEIISTPGQGCFIHVTLPLAPATETQPLLYS
jgi:PAS domain S-box-containing protein